MNGIGVLNIYMLLHLSCGALRLSLPYMGLLGIDLRAPRVRCIIFLPHDCEVTCVGVYSY